MKSETKKCKYCQSDIPKKATVCPVCKRTLKKSHGCLISILVFVVIICGGVATTLNMNSSVQKSVSGVSDDSEYITKEEFGKIKSGMTYKQVSKIIGSEGELESSVDSGDITIEIYTWYGNGVAGSNANVTFTNGEVTAKAQVGLE